MASSTLPSPVRRRPRDPAAPASPGAAAAAATRVTRAGTMLGALGLAASLFVITRMFQAWRIGARATGAGRLSLLGQRLSYPIANLEAIFVVVLALAGWVVIARLVTATLRELGASRRFSARLAARAPEPWQGVLLIEDSEALAFCAGLARPRVYVSTGARALLDADALDAVIAHERHHALRRDPARLAAGRVLARALFFVPGVGALTDRQRALAELTADESAIAAADGDRSALARAMLGFTDAPAGASSVGIDPARIDYLLGEPPSWRFPVALSLAGLLVITLLIAVAALAGRLASGSATLALPVLSAQPCVVMLAGIPGALALLAASAARRVRAHRAAADRS